MWEGGSEQNLKDLKELIDSKIESLKKDLLDENTGPIEDIESLIIRKFKDLEDK